MPKPIVIQRLDQAWKLLSEEIDEKNQRFIKNHGEEGLADNHFVCWEEGGKGDELRPERQDQERRSGDRAESGSLFNRAFL